MRRRERGKEEERGTNGETREDGRACKHPSENTEEEEHGKMNCVVKLAIKGQKTKEKGRKCIVSGYVTGSCSNS